MKHDLSIALILPMVLSMSILVTGCTSTQPGDIPAELLRIPYTSTADDTRREFLLYLPRGYDPEADQTWPVLLFLHGHGERGNGTDELDFVMKHGPLYEAWIQKRDLPFLIIAPQLHTFGMESEAGIDNRNPADIPRRLAQGVPPREADFTTNEPMAGAQPRAEFDLDPLPPDGWERVDRDLMQMLDFVLATYRADTSRLYLSGVSYGGFGTWYLASRHPTTFAAISPVVGWGHPDFMPPIAEHQVPVWAFAGGRDATVKSEYFFAGLNKLEELGHTSVRFTIHEDMGHDAWKRIYAGDDIYTWLLSNSL